MSGYGPVQAFFCWLAVLGSQVSDILRRIVTSPIISRLQRRRVPVLLQLNAVECGAACLAMILNYHGRKTRVAECRETCGVGRDGATAHTISKAARSYGLRVKAFSLEPPDFKYLQLPAIVHWEFEHFVVVERWSPEKVDVVDPASGRHALTAHEFKAGFTGVVLTLEPGVYFQTRPEDIQPAWRRYLLSTLRAPAAAGLLLQILGASLSLVLLGLALPVVTKIIVDRVLPFRIVSAMPILGTGLVLVVVAQAVATYLRAAVLIYLQARLDMQIMLGFFERLLSLPFRFFQQRNSGDLLMRLGSNAVIREALTSQTLSTLLDGALVAGYLAILLTRAPLFGLLAFGVGLLQAAILLGTLRRLRGLTQRDLAAQSASQSYLVEALSGVAALKASGSEDQALEHWSSLFANELNASLRRGHFSAAVDTALTMLRTLSPLLLLWVGTLKVLNGAMSLGTMLALMALAAAFLGPLAALVSNGQRFQLVAAHLERIADVLDARPEQDLRLTCDAPQLTGRIELRNISFRYDPNAPFVLRNVSLTIDPGRRLLSPVAPVPARVPWPCCFWGFTCRPRARFCTTAFPWNTSTIAHSGAISAWCFRSRSCLAGQSVRTSPSIIPASDSRKWSRRPDWRQSMRRLRTCPWAMKRGSPKEAADCPAVSASGFHWRVLSQLSRPFSSWTRQPVIWM
jgi:ATP-binding cassette, subfamily B, bacterial